MTTHEQLKALEHRLTDAIDRQDWTAAQAMTATGVRVRMGGQDLDLEGWLAQGRAFYAAFPDGRHEIVEVVTDGDRIAVRGVWRGTHRGSFQGVPASGRAVAIDMMMVDRFVEGRLVQRAGLFDAVALMQQIGAFPTS